MNFTPLNESRKQELIRLLSPLYEFLKKYHSYDVEGLDKISNHKNYLFALNHSLATYDILLFAGDLYFKNEIWIRPILDDLLFKTPILNRLCDLLQPIQGHFDAIQEVLEQGESILLAPGGMKESLRSSKQKKTILWDNRKGFIKLSIRTNTPVILAACPHSDDLYDIKKNIVTDFFYKKFKLPLPFAKGKNTLLPFLPKKIKLTHYIDGPFVPPKYEGEEDFIEKTEEFHAFICDKMKKLLLKSQ